MTQENERTDNDAAFAVDEGWLPLVREAVADVKVIDPTIQIVQVKEKFGGLRIYVNTTKEAYEAVYARIRVAEDLAAETCEICGGEGRIRTGGWIRNLCDACQDERESRKREWE